MRVTLLPLVVVIGVLATATAVPAQHGPPAGGVEARQLAASVHRDLGCGRCHGEMEHAAPESARASCATCHRREAAEYAAGSHGPAAWRDPAQAPTCVSCHGSHGVPHARDPQAATSPAQAPLACGRCHEKAARDFATSVHARALAEGLGPPPSCAACHGAHEAAGPLAKNSPVSREGVADTCRTCHVEAGLRFRRSVHGTAVARGVPHAPTCTNCHSTHGILASAHPGSPTERLRVAGETCGRCHGSLRITDKHDLPVAVVQDFQGSYHGLAGARGDRRAANCASCHGYHEIRPSSSTFSRTNPANLERTCGACHPGAADQFARGGVHHIPKSFGHRLVDLVRGMYVGMIGLVIGLMLVHNAIDFRRRWRERGHHPPLPPGAPAQYLRFTLNERTQHWVLAASFVILAVTGFALRLGWRLPLVDGQLQEVVRAGTHRAAAVVFAALAVYHLGYLTFSARGRAVARAILPRLRRGADAFFCAAACMRIGPASAADWRELIATVRYNLGLTGERPRYGRFTYWEKMEYWALAWGAVVMLSTGLTLWFEVPVLNRVPTWAFEIFRTVHFYEATLAVLAIIVWHFYYVIVNPDVFPLNRAMTRGTLTGAQMAREHPLELPRAPSPACGDGAPVDGALAPQSGTGESSAS